MALPLNGICRLKDRPPAAKRRVPHMVTEV
jgi:hypothetical protein